ncbi:MAG: hypothetical protein ABIR63_07440 [Sphingomicrobium sp.]
MPWKEIVAAVSMIAVASPVSASQVVPDSQPGAPQASADSKYCLRVEAATGTRLETVQCWTREQWAEMEVDVDKDWAKEGVRITS